jgi:hypothetical protein
VDLILRARKHLRTFARASSPRDVQASELRLNAADLTTIETLVQELAPDPKRVVYAIDVLDRTRTVTPLLSITRRPVRRVARCQLGAGAATSPSSDPAKPDAREEPFARSARSRQSARRRGSFARRCFADAVRDPRQRRWPWPAARGPEDVDRAGDAFQLASTTDDSRRQRGAMSRSRSQVSIRA